jgi:hypothetical protein
MINLADLAALTSLGLDYFKSLIFELIIDYGMSLIVRLLPSDVVNFLIAILSHLFP